MCVPVHVRARWRERRGLLLRIHTEFSGYNKEYKEGKRKNFIKGVSLLYAMRRPKGLARRIQSAAKLRTRHRASKKLTK